MNNLSFSSNNLSGGSKSKKRRNQKGGTNNNLETTPSPPQPPLHHTSMFGLTTRNNKLKEITRNQIGHMLDKITHINLFNRIVGELQLDLTLHQDDKVSKIIERVRGRLQEQTVFRSMNPETNVESLHTRKYTLGEFMKAFVGNSAPNASGASYNTTLQQAEDRSIPNLSKLINNLLTPLENVTYLDNYLTGLNLGTEPQSIHAERFIRAMNILKKCVITLEANDPNQGGFYYKLNLQGTNDDLPHFIKLDAYKPIDFLRKLKGFILIDIFDSYDISAHIEIHAQEQHQGGTKHGEKRKERKESNMTTIGPETAEAAKQLNKLKKMKYLPDTVTDIPSIVNTSKLQLVSPLKTEGLNNGNLMTFNPPNFSNIPK